MAPKTREERLFGAACLKLTLDRAGNPSQAAGSEIYRDTLNDLGLSEEDVEAYLAENRSLVQAALDARRQAKN